MGNLGNLLGGTATASVFCKMVQGQASSFADLGMGLASLLSSIIGVQLLGSVCPRQVRREKSEPGTPIPVGQGGYTGIKTTSSSGKVLAGGAGSVKTIG